MLRIEDTDRVRLLQLDRTDALNAFNEALYDALTDALLEADDDPSVAVVVLTGRGRAFSAGTDLLEMAGMSDGTTQLGRHGFSGLIDTLTDFGKPLICAVNGIGVGIGATILGLCDLALMSTEARLKCPFASLGVAPEAASSATFPALVGRQHATWALMSSEWLSAQECLEMGLVWKLCPPAELLDTAMHHARLLARLPIASLVEIKRTVVEPLRPAIREARERENEAFHRLLGSPANVEALTAFAERRDPDFVAVEAAAAGEEQT